MFEIDQFMFSEEPEGKSIWVFRSEKKTEKKETQNDQKEEKKDPSDIILVFSAFFRLVFCQISIKEYSFTNIMLV